jgi:hypothetical protein
VARSRPRGIGSGSSERDGTVTTYIIVMEGVSALLLIGLAGRLALTGWRGPRGPFRVATVGASAVFALFGATSLQHMLHLAAQDDLVPSGWGDVMLGPSLPGERRSSSWRRSPSCWGCGIGRS